ncbi:MAG: efflux RND transporter permease subunit [Planctomycetota bacterium]|nr:efflux RND transporter permease subunit [Planctomycetota bacterium]
MSDLFFRNRRLLVLTLVLIMATGGFALMQLPRQEDPTLTPRFGLVMTQLPGATAERVEALVTEKIERELRDIEEISVLSSTSRAGVSAISVELADTVTDVDTVWSRVRDRLGDARALMPPDATAPELRDREETDTYTFIAALRWDAQGDASYAVLRRLAEDLRDRMRDIGGTAFVKIFGAPDEEIRVELDREALARLSLTAADIAERIRGGDAKVAAGIVRGAQNDLTVEVSGELDSLERVRKMPVAVGARGEVLRLEDVGTVRKTVAEPAAELALVDGKPGVVVAARMAKDLRIDQWATDMHGAIDAAGEGMPSAVDLGVIFDQSTYVDRRLGDLFQNFLIGVGLVVLVIFFTMGWRSAVVVGLALPLSTLMVLAGLRFVDVPIQQMSITGLIIALGLLIDNAIIMVDEVSHRLQHGMRRGQAIRESVRLLAVPLAGSTFTTVLAFMPMLVVPGPMGEFVGTISISVVLALVSSLFLALTVLPTLVALLGGRGTRRISRGWPSRGVSFAGPARIYKGALGFMLRHPVLAIAFALALPLVGFGVMDQLDEQFFPSADRNQLRVEVRLPAQASLEQTYALAKEAGEVLTQRDDVRRVHFFVGRDAPKFYYNMLGGQEGSPNFAQALVQMTTPEGVTERARDMQAQLDARFPKAQVLVRPLEQGPPFDAPIEMRIYGSDLTTLRELGEEARRVLARVPDVTHTRTTLTSGRPKLALRLDEESLRRTGLVNTDVAAQLGANLEGAAGGSLLESTEELPVRVRLARTARSAADDLDSIDLLPHPDGSGRRAPIPVAVVGESTLVPEDGTITRRGGRRLNTVKGYVQAGVLPSVVLARYEAALEKAGFEVPPGYRVTFGGEQAERNQAVAYLLSSVAVLGLLMISSLVLSFRSFRLAGLILFIAGLSMGLGFLALYVFDYDFGFMAIVGTLGLVGIAVNDAIAVLAGIRADPKAVTGDAAAITEVVFRSTRHVLSTTLTTIAGFVPLLVAGGGFWPPLAISIAGGVAGATVLALLFLPAGYRLLMGRRAPQAVAA